MCLSAYWSVRLLTPKGAGSLRSATAIIETFVGAVWQIETTPIRVSKKAILVSESPFYVSLFAKHIFRSSHFLAVF